MPPPRPAGCTSHRQPTLSSHGSPRCHTPAPAAMSKHQPTVPLAPRGQESLFAVNTGAAPADLGPGCAPGCFEPLWKLGSACRGALGTVFFSLKKKTRLMKTRSLKNNSYLGFILLKSLQSKCLRFQKQVTFDAQLYSILQGITKGGC